MKATGNLTAVAFFLCAIGNNTAQTAFTRITTGSIVNDGGFVLGGAWGDYDGDGQILTVTEPPRLKFGALKAIAVATHNLALKTDGSLWGWGETVPANWVSG